MPDAGRVAEVKGGKTEGSGYLIAPGLILTAWHVAGLTEQGTNSSDSVLRVRLLRDALRGSPDERLRTHPAWLIWPLSDPGPDLDFALLGTNAPTEPQDGALWWNELGAFADQEVGTMGFPDFAINGNARDTCLVVGHASGGSALKAKTLGQGTIDVRLRPESLARSGTAYDWQGMSGAAVFAGPDLIGVVRDVAEVSSSMVLKALPIARLLGHDMVRVAIRTSGLLVPERRKQSSELFADETYDFSDLQAAHGRGFVGRDWILEQLDQFRRCSTSGYFCIQAGAGLGKTAIAARIAAVYGASVFFFSVSEGRTRLIQCLRHIAADLIARFALNYDRRLPDRAGQDWGFVRELLEEAVTRSIAPILLVIDGLDEADEASAGNTLLLPGRLPAQVHVVLTSRVPLSLHLDAQTAMERLELSAFRREHQDDVRTFLQLRIGAPVLRAEVETASEGNFMYLRYLIEDFDRSNAQPSNPYRIGGLPRGLTGYYERFWEGIQATKNAEGWADWNSL